MVEGSAGGSPYRSGRASAPKAEGRENGIVDDLIRQFADPLAFYRELVQNSIDAGASRVVVNLGWEPDPSGQGEDDPPGTLTVAVRDDGCGMDRDVLENQLTVLFRSGKEEQEGKIGKFGVGFVSVLALKPELVAVRTSTGQGERWTLHLAGDQSYELFRAHGAGASGTTVTLHVPARRSEVEPFVAGSERALVRWCRHAEIPIQLVANVAGHGEPLREARVDRPLGLDAIVQVEARKGGTRVVAGLPHDGEPYLAFFNRGLLLHETSQDLFGAVMISIQDGRLEHTLSRDNVRRDAHYERALRFAREVVEQRLTRHAQQRLVQVALGAEPEPPLDVLLNATLAAGLPVDESVLRFPTIEPSGRRGAVDVRRLRRDACVVAGGRDALSEAMAEAGVPILDLSVARHPSTYLSLLCSLAGRALSYAAQTITLASPVVASGSDGLLLDRFAAILDDVWLRPERPTLAVLAGARAGALCVAGRRDAELPVALTLEDADTDPFPLLWRPPLLLNVGHAVVAAARRAAESEPTVAAALLARAVLLERKRLDDRMDEAWLEHAAERVEEAGP